MFTDTHISSLGNVWRTIWRLQKLILGFNGASSSVVSCVKILGMQFVRNYILAINTDYIQMILHLNTSKCVWGANTSHISLNTGILFYNIHNRAALIMHCQALIKQHQKLAAVVLQQYQAVLKKLEEDQEFMEGVMILAQKERVGVELKRFEDISRGEMPFLSKTCGSFSQELCGQGILSFRTSW